MKVKLLQKECNGAVVELPDHHALLLIAQGKAERYAVGGIVTKLPEFDNTDYIPTHKPKRTKRKAKKKC